MHASATLRLGSTLDVYFEDDAIHSKILYLM